MKALPGIGPRLTVFLAERHLRQASEDVANLWLRIGPEHRNRLAGIVAQSATALAIAKALLPKDEPPC